MNSYQRVLYTLQNRPVDRVPVFAVLGAYAGKLINADLRTLYSDADVYVAGQCAVQKAFGFDLVLATFDYGAIAEAFGGEIAWFTDQAPNVRRPAVRNAASALRLPLPDPRRTARLPVILTAIQQLSEIFHEVVPLIAAVPGPGALPALVLGLEGWLETVLFDAPAARSLLEWSARFFVSWSNALLEAGVTTLVVTESVASAEVTSRDLFASSFLPHLSSTLGEVHGPIVFHHGGGRIGHVLDLLPALPGLVGIAISSKDDLVSARRIVGRDVALIGNLDNLSLSACSPEEIHEQALRCLQNAAPAGRFILSNSAADVSLSTSPEALKAMLRASQDYSAGVAR